MNTIPNKIKSRIAIIELQTKKFDEVYEQVNKYLKKTGVSQ